MKSYICRKNTKKTPQAKILKTQRQILTGLKTRNICIKRYGFLIYAFNRPFEVDFRTLPILKA